MFDKPRLVLASASPRRLDILRSAGIEPLVCPVDAEELTGGLSPADLVLANARLKAAAAAEKLPDDVVVAADTVVALGDKIFGKPRDAEDAEAMLHMLAGREHSVFTGVAVYSAGEISAEVAESKVRFRQLTDEEIADYVAGGEPLDKAGAYAIQGGAAKFATEILGDYDNIVGLPMRLLGQMLTLSRFRNI